MHTLLSHSLHHEMADFTAHSPAVSHVPPRLELSRMIQCYCDILSGDHSPVSCPNRLHSHRVYICLLASTVLLILLELPRICIGQVYRQ